MNPSLKISFYILITIYVFFSCKKEPSDEGNRVTNKPPVANAGTDIFITLPVDSIILDGSASYDPDGTVSTYNWSRVSGPASFTIATPQSAITKINQMDLGVYKFELKITDNKGAVDRDTVMITIENSGSSNHPPVANAGSD